jgi:hypothetical protein
MPPHVFPSEYLFSGCFGELLTADDSFSFFVGHVTAVGREGLLALVASHNHVIENPRGK